MPRQTQTQKADGMKVAYDLVVIGAGSGGIAAARRAAAFGTRVAVVEAKALGGTCVNVGCVPKKMMWWASSVRDFLSEARQYGFLGGVEPELNWSHLHSRVRATVTRLNGVYEKNLEESNIDLFSGWGRICSREDELFNLEVKHNGGSISKVIAKKVLLATGGKPSSLVDMQGDVIPGAELALDSDGFFMDDEFNSSTPKRVAVIGAGYIAVELAQVLKGLGVNVDLFVRGDMPLRRFDRDVSTRMKGFLESQGVRLHVRNSPAMIEKTDEGLEYFVKTSEGSEEKFGPFDRILSAIGRDPLVSNLGLEDLGVVMKGKYISVDELQQTNIPGLLAVGDVCGNIELTPMAIAAGRRLADRIFGGVDGAKADYEMVPTVVFSHPPIGTIGMTETEARVKLGSDNVEIYSNTSVNLYYSIFDVQPNEKPRIFMKLVCDKRDNSKVVGLHCIGMGCDELLQGFGVAMKMGATKKDFDSCVAIHPSAAEEMVTMAPWGFTNEEFNKLITK